MPAQHSRVASELTYESGQATLRQRDNPSLAGTFLARARPTAAQGMCETLYSGFFTVSDRNHPPVLSV